MKQAKFFGLLVFLLINSAFMSCDFDIDGGDLARYQQAGKDVAARTWSENYDCSNFSVQFYQNCYKAGLPCRIRFGTAGGIFKRENHAWNSVFIEGQWLDWEPQRNDIYYGHTQNQGINPHSLKIYPYKPHDFDRIMFELIGRNVPSHIIDKYEIDKYLSKNSPFNAYFGGLCIGEETTVFSDYLKYFQHCLSSNGQGDIFKFLSHDTLFWVYNLNGKHYVLYNLEANDPFAGRSITRNYTLPDFSATDDFVQLNNSLLQESMLTLIDIPAVYNGQYIKMLAHGFRESPLTIDGNTSDYKYIQIKNGRADIPLWERADEQKRYKGNDTIVALTGFYNGFWYRLSIEFYISDSLGGFISEEIEFASVSFSNGGAVLSWNDQVTSR